MKIGYLSDIFPKTSETFVVNEVMGLAQSNKLRIFSLEAGKGNVPNNVDVTYFKKRLVKDGLSSLKAGLGKDLIKRSAHEHYFRMIAEYFSDFSEDVEILHRHFATNSIVYYLAQILKVPYTVTTHAWDIFAKERYPHLDKVLKSAAKVITISNFNKDYMIKNFGLKEEKIEVVRMGIDPDKFASQKIPGDRRKILSVGRLIEKKGFEYAIYGVHTLTEKFPEIEYTILGSGPEESKLRSLIKEHGLEEKVKIISGASDEKLLNEYKKAGTFILPCVQAQNLDMDGIPVVLMEAMAMEKMVISTKISGIPELISHGKSGLLVRPRDSEGLASAIEDVLLGRVDSETMCKEGRKKVVENFNIKDQILHMNAIYENVLSGDL
jgi:glycosyltransferase involved in cell wall biosynthesis